MELADIWLKMAKNETLTPQELEFLRIQGKNTQQNNAQTAAWVSADGNPRFERPYIVEPSWEGNPMGTFTAVMATDATIANNTATDVTFETYYKQSNYFNISSDNKTFQLVRAGMNFLITGVANWASNGTGYRAIQFEGFTGGVSIGVLNLCVVAPVSTDVTVMPFSFVVAYNSMLIDSFKLITRQTSGGNLDLTNIIVSLSIL